MEKFTRLLHELSEELDLDLYPDPHGACVLLLDDRKQVHLECDLSQQHLLVITFICEIPAGKFRENTLRDALKANYPHPLNGTLSYFERENQLALFARLDCDPLNGKKLAEFLNAFIEKSKEWRKAIESGNTSLLVASAKKHTDDIFSMKAKQP
ncbi:MAG: CesT family type III secretion system chaperone [Chlamydiota bacterium]